MVLGARCFPNGIIHKVSPWMFLGKVHRKGHEHLKDLKSLLCTKATATIKLTDEMCEHKSSHLISLSLRRNKMPHSDNIDREQERFNYSQNKRRQIFKVVEILFWLIVTIIGVGLIVLATLYAYNF